MICLNCGREIMDNSNFCEFCGNKVEKKKIGIFICNGCGKKINESSNFCEFCGKKVENNIVNNIFCTKCGSKLDGGNFCTACGAKIDGTLVKNKDNKNIETKEIVNKEGKNIILNVTRKEKILGFAVQFTVHVDENIIGKLKNGTTVTCNIKPGHHTVNIESFEKNTIQEIDVDENTNSVEIVVVAKMGIVAATAKLVDVIYK